MYGRPGAPPLKGGLNKARIAAGYEPPIVEEAIKPSPALDGQKLKKSIHKVTNELKQKLGATTPEVSAWQLYRE